MRTLLFALVFLSLNAHARLAPSTLDSLIRDADVVLEAAPIKLERTDANAGTAILKIYRVWAGTFDAKEVKISWGGEAHDQSITDLDKDYLLFLKKNKDGTYYGAQYGRSYWPFEGGRITDTGKADLDTPQRYFKYEYPASEVTFTESQKKVLFRKGEKGEKAPRIPVKALREFIASKKKT